MYITARHWSQCKPGSTHRTGAGATQYKCSGRYATQSLTCTEGRCTPHECERMSGAHHVTSRQVTRHVVASQHGESRHFTSRTTCWLPDDAHGLRGTHAAAPCEAASSCGPVPGPPSAGALPRGSVPFFPGPWRCGCCRCLPRGTPDAARRWWRRTTPPRRRR